ncbi:MAG: hypothetical protein ACFE9Q_06905 [Candidatus Hodarchaeota archaeon]
MNIESIKELQQKLSSLLGVSVPCRYIHSPNSLLKLEDIYKTIQLIEAFIRNPANV